MYANVELEVLKWPLNRVVGDIGKLLNTKSQSLIKHQTHVFYQAVIIYFSRLVRSVHRRHLQPYAQRIIDHLEAVERIKNEAHFSTSFISWPWFGGAVVARAEGLRSCYLQWSKSILFYCLGTYEKATEVLLEGWDRDKTDKGLAPVCDWPTITEARSIRLANVMCKM
jgi:arginine metabolism regulation protein II